MPVPSPTPNRPASITAAQTLVWLQVVFLFCCGFAPAFVWQPAFLAMLVTALPFGIEHQWPYWLALLAIGAGAVAYAARTVEHLSDGERRGRTEVAAGLIVVAALGFGSGSFVVGDEAPVGTLATAAPSILCQLIAWVCVCDESAENWFLGTEHVTKAPPNPDPNPETEAPE